MATDIAADEAAATHHSAFDDAQALITGTLFISLGVVLFKQAGLLTGGTAGLAFLLHYGTGISFGKLFFVINLPFYWLAWRRMGRRFAVKTFVAVALLSAMTEWQPMALALASVQP
ncbi:MAG: YitT family protein, partial [Rubrivivax sp.]